MALPFVAAIREQLPEAKITIVLNSATCGVLQGAGDVTVLGVDVKCLKMLRPIFLPIRYFCFVRKNLSAQQFDVCFLPRRDADSVYSVLLPTLQDRADGYRSPKVLRPERPCTTRALIGC